MQKKYLVVGLIAAIVLFGIVIVTQKVQNGRPVCDRMIAAIEKNDAKGSYNLFSASAQRATSLSTWTTNVKSLSNFYNNQTYKLDNTTTTPTAGSKTPTIQSNYTLGSRGYAFTIACYSQGSQVISFSSQAKD